MFMNGKYFVSWQRNGFDIFQSNLDYKIEQIIVNLPTLSFSRMQVSFQNGGHTKRFAFLVCCNLFKLIASRDIHKAILLKQFSIWLSD